MLERTADGGRARSEGGCLCMSFPFVQLTLEGMIIGFSLTYRQAHRRIPSTLHRRDAESSETDRPRWREALGLEVAVFALGFPPSCT